MNNTQVKERKHKFKPEQISLSSRLKKKTFIFNNIGNIYNIIGKIQVNLTYIVILQHKYV